MSHVPLHVQEAVIQYLKAEARKQPVPCPICRQPFSLMPDALDDKLMTSYRKQLHQSKLFKVSAEQRKLQQKRAELLEKQKRHAVT